MEKGRGKFFLSKGKIDMDQYSEPKIHTHSQ